MRASTNSVAHLGDVVTAEGLLGTAPAARRHANQVAGS